MVPLVNQSRHSKFLRKTQIVEKCFLFLEETMIGREKEPLSEETLWRFFKHVNWINRYSTKIFIIKN